MTLQPDLAKQFGCEIEQRSPKDRQKHYRRLLQEKNLMLHSEDFKSPRVRSPKSPTPQSGSVTSGPITPRFRYSRGVAQATSDIEYRRLLDSHVRNIFSDTLKVRGVSSPFNGDTPYSAFLSRDPQSYADHVNATRDSGTRDDVIGVARDNTDLVFTERDNDVINSTQDDVTRTSNDVTLKHVNYDYFLVRKLEARLRSSRRQRYLDNLRMRSARYSRNLAEELKREIDHGKIKLGMHGAIFSN